MLCMRNIIGNQTERVKIYSLVRSLQYCLDVGRLSVCATQQSRPYRCVVTSDRLSSGEHLSLVRPFTTLLHFNTTHPDSLSVRVNQPVLTVVRFRRRKMCKKSDDPETSAEDEEEESDEESADDDNIDVSAIVFQEDSLLASNYREMTTQVKSSRLDAVVSAGLGISRSKLDELFLASQLRLNGERLHKKSHQLDEGDYVDYVFTSDEGSPKLKRVRVLRIEDSGKGGEKIKVFLRAWRSPQDP